MIRRLALRARATPSLAEANGRTYMSYLAAGAGNPPFQITLAVAPVPLSVLVQTDEGEASASP